MNAITYKIPAGRELRIVCYRNEKITLTVSVGGVDDAAGATRDGGGERGGADANLHICEPKCSSPLCFGDRVVCGVRVVQHGGRRGWEMQEHICFGG